MTTGKALNGKPYAGNPHVRFDEGADVPKRSGRSALLYMIGAAVVCGAFADTTVPYVTGDTSLADGKVLVEYNELDNIKYLAIKPTGGETLTLTGDALQFASGANIVAGLGGTAQISNHVAFSDSIALGTVNMTWQSSATLPRDSYVTVFENVKLDDISPISTDFSKCPSACALTSGIGYPFWIKRTGSGANAEMMVQFQHGGGGNGNGGGTNPTSINVEFRQNGANVEAKILGAGTIDRVRIFGHNMFESGVMTIGGRTIVAKTLYSSDSQTSGGYGIAQLSFGQRRETIDFSSALTSEGVVVATDVDIADIEVVNGLGLIGNAPYYFGAYNVVYDKTEKTLSVQLIDNLNYRHCVKVQLWMSGGNVYARQVYVKDAGADKQQTIHDFDDYGTASSAASINMLALRQKEKRQTLTFLSSGYTTLPTMSGANIDVSFQAVAGVGGGETTTEDLFPSVNTWVTLAVNCAVQNLTVDKGYMTGQSCADGDAVVVDWQNDGITASCQLQRWDGPHIKAVNIELRQNGGDVEMRVTGARAKTNCTDADKEEYYGKKSVTTSATYATSSTARGYALKNITYSITPTAYVNAAGANTMTDSSFAFRGVATRPLHFYVTNASALPADLQVACYDNADMSIVVASAYNRGVVVGSVEMRAGSVLKTPQNFALHRASGHVVLDGAVMTNTAEEAYFNYIAFSNASSVVSSDGDLRVGGVGAPIWHVGGTGLSTLDGNIRLVSVSGNKCLAIDVADAVAGDGVDFQLNGGVEDFGAGNTGYVEKTGAGTMAVSGPLATTAYPTVVADGTLLLDAFGATAQGHSITLSGGSLALAEGTANEMATLAAKADASVVFGTGATLVVADISISEGATLSLGGGVGRASLKVKAKLAPEMLRRISINGRRVIQTTDGYIRIQAGLVILVT